MGKGQIESEQLHLLFEILVVVLMIILFHNALTKETPTTYAEVDTALTQGSLAYASPFFTNVRLSQPDEPYILPKGEDTTS